MRSLWAAGLLLRRLRVEAGMMTMLFVAIAATSFVFAAAPRLFNRAADDALRFAARNAPAAQRNVELALVSSLSPGTDGGVSGVRVEGQQLEQKFPSVLERLISDRSMRVTAARFFVTPPTLYETHLSLRYQDGLTDATRLVSGRWPVDHGVAVREGSFGLGPGAPDGGEDTTPVIVEAALSRSAATEVGIKIGDRLPVSMDASDLAGRLFQVGPTEVDIVGLYEALDPDAAYWEGDASLIQATLAGKPDPSVAFATAYIAADQYPSLWRSGMPFRYEWGFRIDPQRLDGGMVDALQTGLRRLDFSSGSFEAGSPGLVVLRTGLLTLLDAFITASARSESILSIAAIGPFGLAAGVLGMIALLLVTRRRAALALARGRGASGSLVLGTQLWEAIIFAGAASLVGLLAAMNVIVARDNPLSAVLALAVGAAATLLLLGASWRSAQRPLGQLERDDPPVFRVAPRRLVIELTIVGLAMAGAFLLRQRGLTVGPPGAVARFDPLLAAVPALSGLAAGIIAMRVYPLPIRGLAWLTARRHDLVPVLGLRTIGRHPAAANLPLLVLMLTAAFGAFASVIVTSIDRGQVVASYLQVGADYRMEKVGIGALPPPPDPGTIPGVSAVASGILDPSVPLATLAGQRASTYLEAVDPRTYDEVASGTAADPRWPAPFLEEPGGAGLGTDRNPIPAILSTQLPLGSAALRSGDTFQLTVDGVPMIFWVAQRRAGFPGIGDPLSFAVVPFNWVQAASQVHRIHPTVLWLRGPAEAAGAVAASAGAAGVAVRIVSRHDAYATLHDAPLGTAIGTGYALALIVAAAYMAMALIGAVVLSAARRTQDLAYLRTLGVTARQGLALTVVEHAPPVLLALVPGVALGIGVAFLVEPGLGLDLFVGTSGVPLFVDWLTLALMGAVLIAMAVVAVTVGTWLSRRGRLVDALRMGED
jgi:putative ABC transport system permease protein